MGILHVLRRRVLPLRRRRALLLKSSKAKAPGPGGIVNEVLVAGSDSIVRELQRIFFKVCLSKFTAACDAWRVAG